MDIDLILFDWGGTLVSVAGQPDALRRGATRATELLGVEPDTGIVSRLFLEILTAEEAAAADPSHREADLLGVLAAWAGALPRPPPPDRLAAAGNALGDAWIGSLDPLPGAAETLRQLQGRGFTLGLVSNCCVPARFCRRELARQGLADFLDFAVFSSAVGYRKPSPHIYEEALAMACRAGQSLDRSRVLFVGDSPICDVIAPAAMGMKTALVNTSAGLWSEEDYANARPDLRIEAVTQLPMLLRR